MYVKNNKLSHHSKYMCGLHANRKIYKAHILLYIPTYYNFAMHKAPKMQSI